MQIDAITWNVFHGRDYPPDPELFTWRSRLLGTTERNSTHAQVNRDLFREFAKVLAEAPWDVALLQEFPPRWIVPMARACGADMQPTFTSRNWLSALRRPIAHWLPDLMGSWEGGCNAILARGSLRSNAGTRELVLRGAPERRIATFARMEPGLCVMNLHASGPSLPAAEDVRRAAMAAVKWAGDEPLLLGGDLNVSPAEGNLYDELAERYRLGVATAPTAIDHLLVRGLEIVEPPTQWAPEDREVPEDRLALRLSDHAPVQARYGLYTE